MVNEADGRLAAIDSDAANDVGRIVPRGDVLQRVAVNNREVFHVETLDSVDVGHHLVVCLLYGMFLGIGDAGLQRLVDGGSYGSLVGSQQRVTRALGKTVLVAHNVALHNLHLNAQLTHHRLDDGNLLPVLLAEIGTVRLYDIEESADHLADAIEVAGTVGTLHDR